MHCKHKNPALYTIKHHEENLNFFQNSNRLIKNVDKITQEVIDGYTSMLMTKGERITAINARLHAIFVFFRLCFNKGWAESYPLSQLKEDEYTKEPYSEAELKKLLERPTSDIWSEWRSWAAINLLVATGIRASTVVNIKISDVDFEHAIDLVSLLSKITNLITTLDFIQTEADSDVVKETSYCIYFVSDSGGKISSENLFIADKKDSCKAYLLSAAAVIAVAVPAVMTGNRHIIAISLIMDVYFAGVKIAFSTSNYHVFRSGLYARREKNTGRRNGCENKVVFLAECFSQRIRRNPFRTQAETDCHPAGSDCIQRNTCIASLQDIAR